VRLIFKATERKPTHLASDVRFFDGNVKDLPPRRAEKLLQTYPDNFQIFGYPPPLTKLNSTPLVSILIPQRGRPAYIKKCLELILKNTSYPDYEVILICDRDDLASISNIPEDKKIKVVTNPSPVRQMFVGKINYGFRISKASYVVYLANDIEVKGNWLTEAIKTIKEKSPDDVGGLVSFNDGVYNGTLAPHGLISKKFVEEFLGGSILHPAYKHYWSDRELTKIAQKLRRYFYADKSFIFHNRVYDDLQSEGQKSGDEDGKVFRLHQKAGFPTLKEEMKVDIILPTYNRPNFLQRAISSVLKQTSPDWELWIYDDGSDYDVHSVVEKYKDERIHFFAGAKLTQEERKKRGGAIARNILLRKSKNKLVSYLDDDNYYWPEAIEGVIKHFKQYPERDIVFGKLTYSRLGTKAIPREKRQVRFFSEPVIDPFRRLDTSQVIHRRECLEAGYWPEKTEQDLREDGFFFRQLAKYYTFYPVEIWVSDFCLHKYSRFSLQTTRNYTTRRERWPTA